MIPKTDDGRVLFAIPWYNEVVIGTTDTPLDTISLEPVALEKEINFILQTAEKYLIKPPGGKIFSAYLQDCVHWQPIPIILLPQKRFHEDIK